MKSLVTGGVLLILVLAGCNGAQSAGAGGDEFPEFLAGVWKADAGLNGQWGFKFERDGSISKIIHSLAGPINLAEGGTSAEGPEGSSYIFTMGPCEADYNAADRMLKVIIAIDYFQMIIPPEELTGRVEDHFEGPVAEDGKSWQAIWYHYGWLDGSDPPDLDLVRQYREKLTFYPLDLDKLREEESAPTATRDFAPE